MQGWSAFYAAVAGAAAALLGLLFVAVSVNAGETLGAGRADSRRLPEQALQNYLTALLVSLVALMPGISTASLGVATLGLTLIGGMLTLARACGVLLGERGSGRRLEPLRRHGASLLGFAMLMFAALRMSLGDADHRTTFAVSLLVLMASATMVSWQLLLALARSEAQAAEGGGR